MASENGQVPDTELATDQPIGISYDGKQYTAIKEGMASILVLESAIQKNGSGTEAQKVFYNPIQQFNRDLSVLAIRAYGEEVLSRKKPHLASDRREKKRKRENGHEPNVRPSKTRDPASTSEANVEAGIVSTAFDNQTADAIPDTEAEVDEVSTNVQQESTSIPADSQPPITEATDQENGSANGTVQTAPDGVKPPVTQKQPAFTILDALSASGLRALRYSHELPFVTSVTANDLTHSAVESIKLNVKHNKLEDKIKISHDDALAHMYRRLADDLSNRDRRGQPSKANKYDVIDLDPYGTAAPFFDAAIQSVRDDGGLLCITCTDASNWAGHSYVEKSYALYGGVPVKGSHSHEAGLRLILQALATSAARYSLSIEPLLSLSIDFYGRLFVRVQKSQLAVSYLGGKTMVVYNCDAGCSAWETQFLVKTKPHPNKKKEANFFKHGMSLGPPVDKNCEHCGTRMHLAGPMWGGPIHNQEFVQRILDLIPSADRTVYGTIPRMEGMLRTALEEYIPGPEPTLPVDAKDKELARVDHYPFFVMPSRLACTLNTSTPPDDMFRGAIKHLGYRVARSHCKPGSVKTDAPWSTIWFVMREWIRQMSPVRKDKLRPHMAAWKMLGMDKPDANGDDTDTKMVVPDEGGVGKQDSSEQEVIAGEDEAAKPSEEDLRKTLVFDDSLARLGRQKDAKRLVRYQLNPLPNWGPMTKARGR